MPNENIVNKVDSTGTLKISQRVYPSANIVENTQTGLTVSVVNKRRTTSNTTGFHKLKSLGALLPVNNFIYFYSKRTYCPSRYDNTSFIEGKEYWVRRAGSQAAVVPSIAYPVTGFPLTPSEMSAVDGQARMKLYANIKSQKVNLGQLYGEREQTMRLLTSTITRLTKAVTDLKRGDIIGAAKHLGVNPGSRTSRKFVPDAGRFKYNHKSALASQKEAAAKAWLELQYGWKPLLDDCFGAAVFLHDLAANAGKPFGKCTGSNSRRGSVSLQRRDPPPAGWVGGENWVTTKTYNYDVKYVVYFEGSSPVLKQLSELGITNPAAVAWELLPWSFVIDWFLPIGNWISSWDATLGLTFKSGSQTTFSRLFAKVEGLGESVRTNERYYYEAKELYSEVSVNRQALIDFPGIPLPQFKNPVSKQHFLNALALLSTSIRK